MDTSVQVSTFVSTDSTGLVTFWCPLCGGVSHPASGSVYAAGFVVCWNCTLEGKKYIVAWQNQKGRKKGPRFYDHVRQVAK